MKALWFALFVAGAALAAENGAVMPVPVPVTTLETNAVNPLAWNTLTNEYIANPGDVSAHISFFATNISTAEVVVDALKPSCGCTVPKMPATPWRLKPGESGHIDLTVDLRDNIGLLQKGVDVLSTNAGLKLYINIIVPPPGTNALSREVAARMWNLEVARTDRQAVFKLECVKCHLVPAMAKSGERLYQAACGICHDSPQRAEMVPDLSALKVETGTNYWRDMVANGKPDTLMPGSAATNGGPLDEPQIDSLVDFLMQKYPSHKPEAPAAEKKQ